MTEVVTVTERKDRETARRRAAADLVMSELKAFGTARGGRFLVFGSAVEDRMKFDSDLDVVVDFPPTAKVRPSTSSKMHAGGRTCRPTST